MEMIFGTMFVMFGWILILLIPLLVVYLIGLWKIFKKAGRNGWEAIVPFYNTWTLAEISGVAWWYALIIIISNLGIGNDSTLGSIVSLAAAVSNFFICYNLSKKFNKGIGTAILMFVFPFVMIPIMGFSSNFTYDGNVSVSENGPIGTSSNDTDYSSNEEVNFSNINSTEIHYCQYCGKQINSNARFCSNCGREISK